MRMIILEGIATSGKSTVAELLREHLAKSFSTVVITEKQTHEPIMTETSDTQVPFFRALVAKLDKQTDVAIFDRLYLTQAFRANADLGPYAELGKDLLKQSHLPYEVFDTTNHEYKQIAGDIVKAIT